MFRFIGQLRRLESGKLVVEKQIVGFKRDCRTVSLLVALVPTEKCKRPRDSLATLKKSARRVPASRRLSSNVQFTQLQSPTVQLPLVTPSYHLRSFSGSVATDDI